MIVMWEDSNKGILQACSIEGKSAHTELKDDGEKTTFS